MSYFTNSTLLALAAAFTLAACTQREEQSGLPVKASPAAEASEIALAEKLRVCLGEAVQKVAHPEANRIEFNDSRGDYTRSFYSTKTLWSISADTKSETGTEVLFQNHLSARISVDGYVEGTQTPTVGNIVITSAHRAATNYPLPGYTASGEFAKEEYALESKVVLTIPRESLMTTGGTTEFRIVPGLDAKQQEKLVARAGQVLAKTIVCFGKPS